MKFQFTGHPFVDAGVAAMCAAAEVTSPDQLDDVAIERATSKLIRIMTSDSAFALRSIGKKPTRFSTSEMSVIFPNGIHANPSGKPEKQRSQYAVRVHSRQVGHSEDVGDDELCYVSGLAARFRAGKSEFPLLDSKDLRNYHPEHQSGHLLSAEVALAIEFFPLSVLRTGNNEGFFWFVHTADPDIAIHCARMTQKRMEELISRNEGLSFFGDWRVASKNPAAAFVGLIRDIMNPSGNTIQSKQLKRCDLPVTAYVFSNDNRSTEVQAQDLPNDLFIFFRALNGDVEEGANRFQREILLNETLCWRVASAMLHQTPITRMCLLKTGEGRLALKGGWYVHATYAKEVLNMDLRLIRAIEEIATNIFDSDYRKKAIQELRGEDARNPSILFLKFVKQGAMTSDQYQLLVPPTDYYQAYAVRDYLLAALYEHTNREDEARSFVPYPASPDTSIEDVDKHPLLVRVERIGKQLLAEDLGRRAINNLGKSRRTDDLRRTFLSFIKSRCSSYEDFITFFPPTSEAKPAFQARDYLLAFLYEHIDSSELPDPETGELNELNNEGETE